MIATEYLRTWVLLAFCVNTLTVISFFWAQAWDGVPVSDHNWRPQSEAEVGIVPFFTVVGIVDLSLRAGLGGTPTAGLANAVRSFPGGETAGRLAPHEGGNG